MGNVMITRQKKKVVTKGYLNLRVIAIKGLCLKVKCETMLLLYISV